MKIFGNVRLRLIALLAGCKRGMFYINGPDVLPAPLSQEREAEYIVESSS